MLIVLEVLATVVGVVSAFAMLPQIYRVFKRKSAKDLSVWTYLYMFAASVIWVLYGVDIGSFAVWVTNLVSGLTMLGVVVGWVLYGRG